MDTKSASIAAAPKALRQNFIRGNKSSEEARISAAIEIQRVYRGYCSRCRLLSESDSETSKTPVFEETKQNVTLLKVKSDKRMKAVRIAETRESGSSVSSGRTRLDQYYNTYVNRMIEAGSDPDSAEIMSFQDFCANYIQDWWHKVRLDRKPPDRKRIGSSVTLPAAAITIQRAWRRHIDIQVYRYYRDLINFKQKGDPAMMLKCINPNEAAYLDPAAGIHIKFRLAGDRFPPNIYYKIFTHRPVQDLCANSPKDYTNAETKRLNCRDVHNKVDRVPKHDKTGWYERWENNGWRLVSDRLIHHIMSDPITWETSKKKLQFHHNKLQRREDIEKKKKQKKIEWMRKMYKDGMLKAKVEDKETMNLIEGAAAGMVATVDAHGHDAVQDWEVDELLDWTTGLNFDDYWSGWKEIATSSTSEKIIDERGAIRVSDTDPYDISVTHTAKSRRKSSSQKAGSRKSGSTRPSRTPNTPTSVTTPTSSYITASAR